MRIAICDDEKNIRELIGDKVVKQYPEAEIVFFSSGEELLLSDSHIDLLFLDIQMSGRNGMDTARELRKKDKDVIELFNSSILPFFEHKNKIKIINANAFYLMLFL